MTCTVLFTDDFSEGIGAWTIGGGSWAINSGGAYGNYITEVVQGGFAGRNFSAVTGANHFSAKGMCPNLAFGKYSSEIRVSDGAGHYWGFNICRSPTYYPAFEAGDVSFDFFTSGPVLDPNVWYQCDIWLPTTVGGSDGVAQLMRLSDGAILATKTFTSAFTSFNTSRIIDQGFAPSFATLATTQYSDVVLENCPVTGDFTASYHDAGSASDAYSTLVSPSLIESASATDFYRIIPPPPPLGQPLKRPVPVLPVARIVRVTPNYS